MARDQIIHKALEDEEWISDPQPSQPEQPAQPEQPKQTTGTGEAEAPQRASGSGATGDIQQVEQARQEALKENEQLYGDMADNAQKYYDDQAKAAEEWGQQQSQLQQEQTDHTIEQIEQQKAQAQQDYQKEQSAAYVDYRKQTAQHGAGAEAMAAAGLEGTGYAESSMVGMYNAYQNRVAVARQTVDKAIVEYNNAITEAKLQNSAALAQIAYQTLQTKLTLALEGFQYKNDLLMQMQNQQMQIESLYDSRWQTVLDQIYREQQLAEDKRQFDESLAEEKRQFDESLAAEVADYYTSGEGDSAAVLEHVATMSSAELVEIMRGYQSEGEQDPQAADDALGAFLDDCVASGRLTQEQADAYFEQYNSGYYDEEESAENGIPDSAYLLVPGLRRG